jgi:hypothetical protein
MGIGLQITELGVYGVPVSINLQFLLDGVGLVRVSEVGLICLRSNNAGFVTLFDMNKHEVSLLIAEMSTLTMRNTQGGLIVLTSEGLGQIVKRSVNTAFHTWKDVREGEVILADLNAALANVQDVDEVQPATRVKEIGLVTLRDN